jgi:cell wall assembly regulator SMI1
VRGPVQIGIRGRPFNGNGFRIAVDDNSDIRALCRQVLELDSRIEGQDQSEFYRSAATEKVIAEAERASGFALPSQLRDLYRTFDGFDVEHWRYSVFFAPVEHLHLNIQGANNTMSVPRDLDVTDATQELRPFLPANVFGKSRIPFAHGRETHYFLDLLPSSNGALGQVLAFDYSRDKVTVEAQSLSAFLANAVREMKRRLEKGATEPTAQASPGLRSKARPGQANRRQLAEGPVGGLRPLWAEIRNLCSSDEATFEEPAQAADLAKLERALGFPVPAQWRASLLVHNGCYGLWHGIEILSAQDVPRHIQIMVDTPSDVVPRLRGPVQFNSAWRGKIPFACGPQGDFFCLDMEPPDDGVPGQVLAISWEEWLVEVIASSYIEFLHLGIGHLKRGDDK